MANDDILSADGLQLKDYSVILTELQDGINAIYAQDGDLINFDSETPDGQLTNIFAQAMSDIRDLARDVYNSFDPDKCEGVVQDSRYALNYIERQGGTFTIQNIDVTVNQTVTLNGLDGAYNDLNATSYTVADNAGNLWYLVDTATLTSGTHSLPFRSQKYGAYNSVIGTITNQITIVLGVVSVNNSVAPTTLGAEQESDVAFRVRRERSTYLKGLNNLDSMLSKLLELQGVSDADVWQNRTLITDDTGTAGNTVWIIVDGGANTDIADIIYSNACNANFRGAVTVDVTSVAGQTFTVKFDRPNPVSLYIKFDFQLYVDRDSVDITAITEYIAENLKYSLNESAETSKITNIASEAITANGGGGYALNVEISTDGTTWTDYIQSASRKNKFVIDTTRINITVIEAE